MKATKRAVIYAIAVVMAVTCFVPVTGSVYAAGDTSQKTTASSDQNKSFTGWKKKNGKKYYYHKGKIYTGWVKKNGKRTYYCKKGRAVTGYKKIKSTYYEFKKNGVLKRKVGDYMDYRAQRYKSKRKYLILVSYKKHRVRVYKGKKNKWVRKKSFKCTLGKRSTPTPRGTFTIKGRGRYFNTGSRARCWYWTGFIGSVYLFHSVLYNRNSRPTRIIDGRLGRNLSHGCIRLSLKNARWIYKNIPRRTKVVIY